MNETKARMQKTLEGFERQLTSIRGGTVSPGLVDAIRVSYQGQPTPLNHVAFTTVVKGGITVTPHDPAIVGLVEKTLKMANLHAYTFSKTTIMVSVPPVTGEEKEKVRAFIRKLGEEAKISVRNLRKQCRQSVGGLSQDEMRRLDKELQIATDEYVEKIELAAKRKGLQL